MRIAYFGGSFNPPHLGHVMAATLALWTGEVDQVWWAPSFNHPFGRDLAPFVDRLLMCTDTLAQIGGSRMCVSDAERYYAVPGANYTYKILTRLRADHKNCTFRPLLGADILADTSRWKFWEELNQEFPPIIIGRAGYVGGQGHPVPDISSTDVRERLQRGDSIHGLVAPAAIPLAKDLYGSK